jgi:hypothetical protein
MSDYLLNVALGFDLFVSAVLRGKPGETLSGRAGSAYLQGKFRGKFWVPIIDFVMGKKGHCVEAIQGDIWRAKAVILDQGGTL